MPKIAKMDLSELVKALDLESHVEGGYFRQTFKAEGRYLDEGHGKRTTLTSIFYLLTAESPIGHFHMNRSDIVHYYHGGDPITYYLLLPDGSLEEHVMGSDITRGECLQLVVPGGIWKASAISTRGEAGYGLIGEAVAPGFEYQDMQLADRQDLLARFPQHQALITSLTR